MTSTHPEIWLSVLTFLGAIHLWRAYADVHKVGGVRRNNDQKCLKSAEKLQKLAENCLKSDFQPPACNHYAPKCDDGTPVYRVRATSTYAKRWPFWPPPPVPMAYFCIIAPPSVHTFGRPPRRTKGQTRRACARSHGIKVSLSLEMRTF